MRKTKVATLSRLYSTGTLAVNSLSSALPTPSSPTESIPDSHSPLEGTIIILKRHTPDSSNMSESHPTLHRRRSSLTPRWSPSPTHRHTRISSMASFTSTTSSSIAEGSRTTMSSRSEAADNIILKSLQTRDMAEKSGGGYKSRHQGVFREAVDVGGTTKESREDWINVRDFDRLGF